MISVIIPTHKRADLLFFELEHIYMQKDVEFEVIVVNDIEEEDETDAIREKFPKVIYIKDSRIQGPSNKHKAGLKIAKGEYLYMPDDDDYLTDEYFFKKAVSYMKQYPHTAFVGGNVIKLFQYSDGRSDYITRTTLCVSGLIDGGELLQDFQQKANKPISTVSTIFRRTAFQELPVDDMIEFSDSSIYMASLLWGDAYIMDEFVACYRVVVRPNSSLTATASVDFLLNVARQKEKIFFKARELRRISRPLDFWCFHYTVTSNFLKSLDKLDHSKMLLWGLAHCHGSLSIIKYCIISYIRKVLL